MDKRLKDVNNAQAGAETFDDTEDLELRGLLSGVQTARGKPDQERAPDSKRSLYKWLGLSSSEDDEKTWSRGRVKTAAVVLIFILLGAALAPPFINSRKCAASKSHPNSKFVGSELRSNGTHDFKRTVILISIDGLRYVEGRYSCQRGAEM